MVQNLFLRPYKNASSVCTSIRLITVRSCESVVFTKYCSSIIFSYEEKYLFKFSYIYVAPIYIFKWFSLKTTFISNFDEIVLIGVITIGSESYFLVHSMVKKNCNKYTALICKEIITKICIGFTIVLGMIPIDFGGNQFGFRYMQLACCISLCVVQKTLW